MRHLTDPQLNELLDGALPAAGRRRAARHLDSCPACRARLADLQRLTRALGALADEPLRRDLTAAVLAGLPRSRRGLGWRLALAAQAGVAIAVVALTAGRSASLLQRLIEPITTYILGLWASWPSRLSLPVGGWTLPSLPSLRWPSLELPAFRLPDPALGGLDLSALHVALLAATALALFVVGNRLLLRPISRRGAIRGGGR